MARIVGYTFDAAAHCVECVQHLTACGLRLQRVPPLVTGSDEHGVAFDLRDREGNRVRPVFSTDENAPAETCDTCRAPLMPEETLHTVGVPLAERGQ